LKGQGSKTKTQKVGGKRETRKFLWVFEFFMCTGLLYQFLTHSIVDKNPVMPLLLQLLEPSRQHIAAE